MNRLIGRYSEGNKGPLLIVIGGMHGNEPAGIHAVESLLQMLEQEKEKNAGFEFKGALVGLRGNLQAIEQGKGVRGATKFTTVGKPKMAQKQFNSPMAMYSDEALDEIMAEGTLG